MVETTYSSQAWEIKTGSCMCLPLRSKLPRLFFSSPVRERGGFPVSPCHVTKNDSWRRRVPQTVTRENTPFSLPTVIYIMPFLKRFALSAELWVYCVPLRGCKVAPPRNILSMRLNCIWWLGLFQRYGIVITPSSSLTNSGNIFRVPYVDQIVQTENYKYLNRILETRQL